MASKDEIGAVVSEVGPLLRDIDGVLRRGEDEWLVRFPDLDVTLEFDEASDRLVLSAELGEARSEHRVAVHETLLSYALLWRDTGGVGVALAEGGVLVLLLTLYGPEVTVSLLAAVLDDFAVKTRALRTYVALGGEAPIPTDALATTGIRA